MSDSPSRAKVAAFAVLAFASSIPAVATVRGEVVARWSFEGDLLDTAPAGAVADHLEAAALRPPLGTVFVPGVVGTAVQVGEGPGDATVLSAPDSPDLDLAASFTIEAFVQRRVEHGSDWERFATKWFDGGNQWHWAFRGPPGRSQDLFMNGGQQINQGSVTADIGLDEWHHVAVTGDPADGLRLWQDGVIVGSAPYVSPAAGSDDFRIGNAVPGASSLQFSGWVDEFQIHDVAQGAVYLAARAALVAGAPAITSFTAEPAVVAANGSATLEWTVIDADTLTLDGGAFRDSDVTGQESAIAADLARTTTFTLTAANAQGETSARVTVAVAVDGSGPVINEFLAVNEAGLQDEDGAASDWIEIHNPGGSAVPLDGWFLTDDPLDPAGWRFPAVSVPAFGYLVVFASGKDRAIPGSELHADFKLDGEGEYLALVLPDGVTVADEFSPTFPPQQADVSYGVFGDPPVAGTLAMPTPGAANAGPAGPVIRGLTENPDPVPGDDDPIVVRAEILPSPSPVASATLHYRVMFEPEVAVPMTDAGGGIFTATVPASASRPGEMVRWRVTAEGLDGAASRAPAFVDPRNSPEYHGTVIADPSIDTALPVMHRFVGNPVATESRAGTRGAFFHDGEFHDNIFTRIRGGTSQNWPKKSYKIEFNDGHHFRLRDGVPRVDEINLNTTYTDKSYLRAVLAYEHQRDAGMPSPEAFLVHFRQNGAFWNVAILVEQPDRDFLRRWGLDPDGALYKGAIAPTRYEPSTSLSQWEKKTRLHEDKSDLDAFLDGLARTGEPLDRYLFDHVDLPVQINYMATTCITQNIDGSDKNHYLYRDTEGTGEWTMLPWDLDLTFGPNALNTDTIVASQRYASHPYIGARPYLLSGGKYNHFLEVIVADPRTREMLNRRIRTLVDLHLASGFFHDRIAELVDLIGPDVLLDKAKWGAGAHFSGRQYTLEAAAARIVDEYLGPRVPYLTITEGQAGSGAVLLAEDAPATAFVPVDDSLGDAWQLAGFDDSGWLSGTNAVGYERSTGQTFTPLLGIDLLSPEIPADRRIDVDGDNFNENNSCYIRYVFDVEDREGVSYLDLRAKYDDGFVAFLNGTRVAARNSPPTPAWNSEAAASHVDTAAVIFEDIDITAFKSALVEGRNVLAVQAMNQGSTSSDMLFSCELVDAAVGGGDGAGIPPSQPASASIGFGAIEPNPGSGNQDEEFIELVNPNAFAVDVSGWTLEGGVGHLLKHGTVIPAGESLFLSPDVAAFRARAVSPKGNEGRFVQGDYSGHLSNLGETLVLRNAGGAVVAETTTVAMPSDVQRFLVVSEIMFHPADPDGDAEFIELLNASDSVTLDLAGVRFTGGVEFDFTGSAVTSLPPGGRVLVVRSRAAFEAVHGAGLPVAGEFASGEALANEGETLKLEDAGNSTVREFAYDDRAPWPEAADGHGPSLVLISPDSVPDHGDPHHWRPSALPGGSPGGTDSIAYSGDTEAELIAHALMPGGLPVLSVSGDVATVAFVRRLAADDVVIGTEISSDLAAWQDGSSVLAVMDTDFLGDGGERIVLQAPLSAFSGSRVYLRLRVRLRAGD